jgi:hypothetical protein
LVSIHPIAGPQNIKLDIGVILIGDMSSEGHLFTEDYQKKVIEIGNQNVVGFVCQHKMSHDLLNITPGISLSMIIKDSNIVILKIEHLQIYLLLDVVFITLNLQRRNFKIQNTY